MITGGIAITMHDNMCYCSYHDYHAIIRVTAIITNEDNTCYCNYNKGSMIQEVEGIQKWWQPVA